jgi:hypothetical protein
VRAIKLAALVLALLIAGAGPTVAHSTPRETVHVETQSGSRVPHGWNSGAYPGGTIDLRAAAAFARYRGRRLDNVHVYLEARSWSTIGHESWEVRQYKRFPRLLVIDVPLLPESGGGTLAQVAAGRDDRYFRAMARTLVSLGRGNAVLVLGSEFNGDWQSYSAFDPTVFVAAFRHVAELLKAVSPAFRIDWCGNAIDNQAGHDPFRTDYPGDDVVDIIGVDAYEHPDSEIASRGFKQWLELPFGLADWARFAREHHRPFSVPEWGLTRQGGDDPRFIRGMFRFFSAESANLAFEDYFNQTGPPSDNSLTHPVMMPRASKTYAQLWSALPLPTPIVTLGDRRSTGTFRCPAGTPARLPGASRPCNDL